MEKYLNNSILITLLHKYNIRHLVISSGTRNIPFANAVEVDPGFTCYSVVDERSAAFFALGISQKLQEPVAIACTSGTAASNYLSGVTEAYYAHVPLVVITFDRSSYSLHQLETQKIDQPAIFTSACKKSVSLPVVKNEEDAWYCQRLVNEALIALTQRQNGPVHINVPIPGDWNAVFSGSLAFEQKREVNKIDYVSMFDQAAWQEKAQKLHRAEKVLVVMGQSLPADDSVNREISRFTQLLACPILADNLSNFRCENYVHAEGLIKALNSKTVSGYLPDIVISFGANFQERIKELLRAHRGTFEHWSIEPEGVVRDVFQSQTALFESAPAQFFEKMNGILEQTGYQQGKGKYLAAWKKLEGAIKLPDMPFNNFYAVKEFAERIPNGSVLHLAILNAARLMNFFQLDASVEVYSNVNAFGIDGCLPTFMGHACVTQQLSFLVIGDLSFFYGMNALAIKHRKNNIRILLLNNGGGAEFHIQPDSNKIPTIDLHIGAAHSDRAEGWAKSVGYKYLSADDKESLEKSLDEFVRDDHESPVLLEVFTRMKPDGEFTLHVYRELEKGIGPVLGGSGA